MTLKKINFGIRINENLTKILDEIVKDSEYLKPTRSELIEAILHAFFKSKISHLEKGRELIIIKRKEEGSMHTVHNQI